MRWRRRPTAARTEGRRRGRTWLLVSVLAVLVLVAGGFGLYRMITPSSAAVAERTVTVATQTVRNTVSTTGTLEPKQRADLSFASGGTVTNVDVSVGEKVSKGQVLATIDDTTLRANLDAARADLQAAKDNLSQVEGTSTSTTAAIHAANSQVALKQSSLDQAQAAFAAAKLRATISGIVAQVNIAKGDQVGSATNSGGQNSASAGSGTSGNGTSGNGTSGSGGSGGSGSGGGSSASAGTDITVISPNSYVVDTSVGSADLPKVKKGLQAEITPTGATQPIYGTVSSVGVMASTSTSAGGSTTATFPITIDVTEDQKGLFAGASATVSIIVEQRDNVLTAPTAAITTSGGQTVVQKLVNGTKAPTVITVGSSYGAMTEVTKGLAAGDQVVITFGRIPTGTASGAGQNPRRTGAGGFGTGGFGGGGFGNGGGGSRTGAPPAGGG